MLQRLSDRLDDRGIALPFVAIMLVLLMGMTALAVDLGWLYLNGSRVQRGADAAALAGVVYLPGDLPEVSVQSVNGANANGWNVGSINGNPVPGGGPDILEWRDLSENRLEVRLTATVPTFFLRVFGMDEVTISRRATAEYIKPVPIGSPFPTFGDGSAYFYASINGRWTAHIQGDPYSTRCDWSDIGRWNTPNLTDSVCRDSTDPQSGWPGQNILPGDVDDDNSPFNPEFRTKGSIGFVDEDAGDDADGYYYGIEVPAGKSWLEIDLYDPRFNRNSGWDTDCLTFSACPSSGSNIGPDTRFRLYRPDSTPLNPRDNLTLSRRVCDREFPRRSNEPRSWVNAWCRVNNPTPGIWVLRVSTNNGAGSNNYGIRARTNGTSQPRVYGINEVSIFTTDQNTNATMYLAEVHPVHAGKILIVRFYDAGEDNVAGASYTIQRPDGSTAKCVWRSDKESFGDPNTNPSSWPSCVIVTTQNQGGDVVSRFNSQWLEARIEIPASYNCNIDDPLACWWKVAIDNKQPHDRTTWTVAIVGNPVRLVPNEP